MQSCILWGCFQLSSACNECVLCLCNWKLYKGVSITNYSLDEKKAASRDIHNFFLTKFRTSCHWCLLLWPMLQTSVCCGNYDDRNKQMQNRKHAWPFLSLCKDLISCNCNFLTLRMTLLWVTTWKCPMTDGRLLPSALSLTDLPSNDQAWQ